LMFFHAEDVIRDRNVTGVQTCALPISLIGFDKKEIVEISEKIDTFEVSIQPYEDCCTIFVAKHPVTKPNVERIAKSELSLAEKRSEERRGGKKRGVRRGIRQLRQAQEK